MWGKRLIVEVDNHFFPPFDLKFEISALIRYAQTTQT